MFVLFFFFFLRWAVHLSHSYICSTALTRMPLSSHAAHLFACPSSSHDGTSSRACSLVSSSRKLLTSLLSPDLFLFAILAVSRQSGSSCLLHITHLDITLIRDCSNLCLPERSVWASFFSLFFLGLFFLFFLERPSLPVRPCLASIVFISTFLFLLDKVGAASSIFYYDAFLRSFSCSWARLLEIDYLHIPPPIFQAASTLVCVPQGISFGSG